MSYAIELFFDASSDSGIRQLWSRLEVFGGLCLGGIGSRPHIALAVCDAADIDGLKELVDRLAGETPAVTVSLARLGTFPVSPSVIYVAPDRSGDSRSVMILPAENHVRHQWTGDIDELLVGGGRDHAKRTFASR